MYKNEKISTNIGNRYSEELTPILHRVLDVSAKNIQLQQVPNWPRDSLPKSPIVQKLGLIAIPVIYPWWARELEIETEQFGPYSPVLSESFTELLETGQCSVDDNELEVQPSTLDEIINFPEITEKFVQDLISYSNNPVLTQFECLELFSIISVEQESYFRRRGVLRRIISLNEEQQNKICNRVLNRMYHIPHLNAFIHERGVKYVKYFVNESIDAFYSALSRSFASHPDSSMFFS